MLVIRVHRVLDHPACSITFERDEAVQDAFPGVRWPERIDVGYWYTEVWPHPGDVSDLAGLVGQALAFSEERMAQWGGWQLLV